MKLRCAAVALGIVLGSTSGLAHADDTTPLPVPTQPPVSTEPTVPPAAEDPTVPVPPPIATAAPDTPPIDVARERSTPVVNVTEPSYAPTAVESNAPTGQDTGPGSVPPGQIRTGFAPAVPAPTANAPQVGVGATPSGASVPSSGASQVYTVDPGLNFNADPSAGQAPAELRCSGKKATPSASPFLVAPYAGWTEISSFFDHDQPDYAVDGRVVIANGLVARASQGQQSDMFPAYWSAGLRQYVNYDGHNGYDLTISYQPVLAAASGVVRFAGWTDGGYGNMVLIDHGNGYVTLYGHLSELKVKKGATVTAGQQIGISGSTGRSSGPHLHFSVYHNCQVTDPYGWTGTSPDPLRAFDGEQSRYLWLPGHDPLVLNPPPHWPAYPASLALAAPGEALLNAASRAVPPVDRLLLLRLPGAPGTASLSTAAAVTRTDELVTQESQALSPELDRLKRDGYLNDYQFLPSAAAVWVRGTASAAQLEALPGVASLTGVQPRDLQAAQSELAHGVLAQALAEQAPSLWPAGFRSALETWRPMTTSIIGRALVAGAALPGEDVRIVLRRGTAPVAWGNAQADAQTGGFAATLHDRAGQPVPIQAGDRIQLRSGGRLSTIPPSDLTIRARPRRITGSVPPGATVAVTVLDGTGRVLMHRVVTASRTGTFRLRPVQALSAGTQAVVSTTDAAGNQEAATGYVPGMHIDLTTGRIHGWTVANGPYLELRRNGRTVGTMKVRPAPDGSFAIDPARTRLGGVRAGDTVSIGSRWHRRSMTVPSLAARVSIGQRRLTVVGPRTSTVFITFRRSGQKVWTDRVALGRDGVLPVNLPSAATGGDRISVAFGPASGNQATVDTSLITLRAYVGTGAVHGEVPPGSDVWLSLRGRKGKPVATALEGADPLTGAVSGRLRDALGRPVSLEGARALTVRTADRIVVLPLPSIQLHVSRRSGALTATAPARARVSIALVYRRSRPATWSRVAPSTGAITGVVPRVRELVKAVMSVQLANDVSLVRVASLSRGSSPRATPSPVTGSRAGGRRTRQ